MTTDPQMTGAGVAGAEMTGAEMTGAEMTGSGVTGGQPERLEVQRLDVDDLGTLFLFEALDEDQLAWLSATGRVEQRRAGDVVYGEGESATCFFVLLSGTVTMHRLVEGTAVETARTNQRGVYAGATMAFIRTEEPVAYSNSLTAVTDATFWVIESADFGGRFRKWFPMAMHMLEGLMIGLRSSGSASGCCRWDGCPPV